MLTFSSADFGAALSAAFHNNFVATDSPFQRVFPITAILSHSVDFSDQSCDKDENPHNQSMQDFSCQPQVDLILHEMQRRNQLSYGIGVGLGKLLRTSQQGECYEQIIEERAQVLDAIHVETEVLQEHLLQLCDNSLDLNKPVEDLSIREFEDLKQRVDALYQADSLDWYLSDLIQTNLELCRELVAYDSKPTENYDRKAAKLEQTMQKIESNVKITLPYRAIVVARDATSFDKSPVCDQPIWQGKMVADYAYTDHYGRLIKRIQSIADAKNSTDSIRRIAKNLIEHLDACKLHTPIGNKYKQLILNGICALAALAISSKILYEYKNPTKHIGCLLRYSSNPINSIRRALRDNFSGLTKLKWNMGDYSNELNINLLAGLKGTRIKTLELSGNHPKPHFPLFYAYFTIWLELLSKTNIIAIEGDFCFSTQAKQQIDAVLKRNQEKVIRAPLTFAWKTLHDSETSSPTSATGEIGLGDLPKEIIAKICHS